MKKEIIVKWEQTISKLLESPNYPSGALKMRRNLKPFKEELENWNEVRDSYIKQHGQKTDTGNIGIKPGSPEHTGFLLWMKKELDEKSDIDMEKVIPLTDDDVESVSVYNEKGEKVKLSPKEIDGLIELGLYKEN